MSLMLFVAAVASPAPVHPVSWTAAAVPVESPRANSELAGVRSLASDYAARMQARDYAGALAVLRKFNIPADQPSIAALITGMRAAAHVGLGRETEARADLATAERLEPRLSNAAELMWATALYTGRHALAADMLDHLIERFPERARHIPSEVLGVFLKNEPKGQDRRNQDRRVKLARIGYDGAGYHRDYVIEDAVKILVDRGDMQGAGDIAKLLNDPQVIEDLLIQKRYSAIWPQLEQVAGPGLRHAADRHLAYTRKIYMARAPLRSALERMARAYRAVGRYDDAIALRSEIPASMAGLATADEHTGWAVDQIGRAFYDAGRADEGDELFRLLNEAPMPPEYWRVSQKINRLILLMLHGRYDKALPLIGPTEKVEGSAFARQLVRSAKYCIYARAGRGKDLPQLLARLLKHAEDAPHATADALLCAGDMDNAETVTVTALKNTKATRIHFLRSLQAVELPDEDVTQWNSAWAELRKRPAVAAEFASLARDLPPAFFRDLPNKRRPKAG